MPNAARLSRRRSGRPSAVPWSRSSPAARRVSRVHPKLSWRVAGRPQTMPHPGAITAQQAFAVPRPPPDVVPKGKDNPVVLAMDEQAVELSTWAAGTWASGWFDGPLFMGYPALSLLAVLPEYRRMAKVLATECTRKWIKLGAADSKNKKKLDRVTALEAEMKRLDVRGAMRRLIELDAFFGRAHLFVDVGTDPDNRDELVKSIGNGRNGASKAKFAGERNFLRGVKPIEPVWCYPSRYNATNPLKDDWYAPQTWFVQGQEIHVSRLLRFVGREVPDLLKPAYMFGGVSLSQLMKPYVDRWITVVQSVVDILVSFSTSGIKTNLETLLKPSGGDMGLPERAELFANTRTNRGLMLIDKESEDFFQFNVPLSELEALLSKFQELLCSISGEPVVKLLGIQPAGLNASSEGELTSWFDWCEAFREKFCAPHLTTIIDFAQLSSIRRGRPGHHLVLRIPPGPRSPRGNRAPEGPSRDRRCVHRIRGVRSHGDPPGPAGRSRESVFRLGRDYAGAGRRSRGLGYGRSCDGLGIPRLGSANYPGARRGRADRSPRGRQDRCASGSDRAGRPQDRPAGQT